MKKISASVFLILISCLMMAGIPFKGEKCIVKSEFIYQSGDVPFPSCHASTICQAKNGLIAAWFGGTAERNPDVGIWLSRFTGGKWTKPVEVANGVQHKTKRYPCWNPVLFNAGKKILLFYKVGPSPSAWWGEMVTSEDNGKTWSVSRRLPEDINGPIKDKPVLLKNGELLCPSSTENDGWRVHIEMTSDFGITWERTPDINGKEIRAIQPTILIQNDGSLQMLCRSAGSFILSARSKDNGRTWSDLTSTGLPNPNSGIDAVSLRDGRHLLVYNHIARGRNILNIAISDDGRAWNAAALLENDVKDSEFSYPAIIQTSDGMVHITYTWNRKFIKHVIIDPAKITPRSFLNGEWPEE